MIETSRHTPDANNTNRENPLPPDPAYFARFVYPLLDEEDRDPLNATPEPILEGLSSSLLQHVPGLKTPMPGNVVGEIQSDDHFNAADFLPTPPFTQGDLIDPILSTIDVQSNFYPGYASASSSPNFGMGCSADQSATPRDESYLDSQNLPSPLDLIPIAPPETLHPAMHAPPPSLTVFSRKESQMRNINSGGQPCDCFAACVQVLQSLHDHSTIVSTGHQSAPPFDIVLTINREAIDSCSAMLQCNNCVFKCGRSISTMMLATILGKVLSLYRAACYLRFGSAASNMHVSAQVAFGAYTVTGENRQLLEIEILLLEMRKLERTLQVYADRFQKLHQAERDGEVGVYSALTTFLTKNLHQIVDFLLFRKGASQNRPQS